MKLVLFLTLASLSIFGSFYYNSKKDKSDVPEYIKAKSANSGCVIVSKSGEFLMVKNAKTGKFSMPGGTMESGENAIATAERETLEEIGIKVEVVSLVKEMENGFILFLCKIDDSQKEINHEHKFKDEISGNSWINIAKVSKSELRFPDEYLEIYKMFESGNFDKYVETN